MVIEPPGKPRIAGVFEIHDRILVAVEQGGVEHLGSFVRHPRIAELRIRVNCTRDKAAEVRSRGCAVETVVVIEDAFQHGRTESGKPLSLPESAKKCKCFRKEPVTFMEKLCERYPVGTNITWISVRWWRAAVRTRIRSSAA